MHRYIHNYCCSTVYIYIWHTCIGFQFQKAIINYYNCTISGKWNEVTLLSLLSIGLLVGELGNNWGSKCRCFFILPSSLSISWFLLLNSIGCNLRDSPCMLATGLLVASSAPVGGMVMLVRTVLWRRSCVVGLNTRKQLCSVWWSLRLGFPIRTKKQQQKKAISFYTDEHLPWVHLSNLLLISAFHRMGYLPFWYREGKES